VARPQEFERDAVLEKAIAVFSEHGYEGTSTDVLLRAMGISRQSMYNTFGDKRGLYLEALQHYNAGSTAAIIRSLGAASSSPLKGLEAALLAFASRPPNGASACMGVSAICEFGRSDHEINLVTEAASRTLLSAFERLINDAKAAGEIDRRIDVRAAARFMTATLSGLKITARAGATREVLRDVAHMAIRSLR
jgi:AcrR family transcriptional regulator